MRGTLMDKKKKGKHGKKKSKNNSYTALKMEFANNVSQDSSLQKSVISTFSQCSQQKFLIHMHGFLLKEKKKKKNHKNTNFFYSKIKFL